MSDRLLPNDLRLDLLKLIDRVGCETGRNGCKGDRHVPSCPRRLDDRLRDLLTPDHGPDESRHRWATRGDDAGSQALSTALREGWEPFAAVAETRTGTVAGTYTEIVVLSRKRVERPFFGLPEDRDVR